jgi:phage recombination protein Bet
MIMTALKTVPNPKEALPTLSLSENELMEVLRNSLYPGAQDASIKMVIGYCKAAGLDPIQKPVHIVPMSVKKAGTNTYEWRDVIMPGIGSYRTQAVRSGQYAGVSDPEFGEDITESMGGTSITYPKWCRVVVKRLLPHGAVAEFSAKEFWKENYATAGKDSAAPNAMWKKRPYAQLAKCAEAQALRKAFPEFGAQPTADEMEGKSFDDAAITIDNDSGEIITPKSKELPPYGDDEFEAKIPLWQKNVNDDIAAPDIVKKLSTKYQLSEKQKARIFSLKKQKPGFPIEASDFVSAMEAAEKGEQT